MNKRRWMQRPYQLQVSKNKSKIEVRLFRRGNLIGWDDGKDLREAFASVRALWLRSKLWDPTIKTWDEEDEKFKQTGGWVAIIRFRHEPKAKVPPRCWRCGLQEPAPRCIDHGSVSHYSCLVQTFDQKIRVKGEDGKVSLVDRPGARGISERWLPAE